MTVHRNLSDTLRQMLAVLESERQALAALDIDAILGTANEKSSLCDALEAQLPDEADADCRAMIDAARRQNEVNRQIRNLVAANVAARLDAISGSPRLYAAAREGAATYRLA